MVTHTNTLNSTGLNEMLFAGQICVHVKNHALVAGAHWRLLANTVELSMHGSRGGLSKNS